MRVSRVRCNTNTHFGIRVILVDSAGARTYLSRVASDRKSIQIDQRIDASKDSVN